MYQVSEEAKQTLLSPSRTIRPYGNVGNYKLNESNIVQFSIEKVLSNSGLPGIGGAIASKLELTIVKELGIPIIANNPIHIGVEVLVNGVYEQIPLGTFLPSLDSIKKTEQTLKIECFDRMTSYDKVNYTTKLNYPVYVQDMLTELRDVFGVPIAGIENIPTGIAYLSTPVLSIRSVIGEIAELLGANALMNRNDQVEFVKIPETPVLTVTADNYIDFMLTSDEPITFTKLSASGALLDGTISVPAELEDGYEFTFKNDAVDSVAGLQRIYDSFLPLSYQPYEMKLQGLPHIDVGDKVTVIDKNNVSTNVIVLNHKITFNGGLISEWNNEAPENMVVETGSTGTTAISDKIDTISEKQEAVIHFENKSQVNIRTTPSNVANLALTLSGNSEGILHFTALVEATASMDTFFELVNNGFSLSFRPAQTLVPGFNLVNFTVPLLKLETTVLNMLQIKVRTDATAGTAVIKPFQAQVIVRGRNISDGAKSIPFTGGSIDEIISVEGARVDLQIGGYVGARITFDYPHEIKGVVDAVISVQATALAI